MALHTFAEPLLGLVLASCLLALLILQRGCGSLVRAPCLRELCACLSELKFRELELLLLHRQFFLPVRGFKEMRFLQLLQCELCLLQPRF